MSAENKENLFGDGDTAEKRPSNPEGFVSRVYEVSDEESTIFSAPSEHREKVKKKSKLKPIITSALALILVVAITVTTVILWPAPAEEEDEDSIGITLIQMIDDSVFYNLTEYHPYNRAEFTVTGNAVQTAGKHIRPRDPCNISHTCKSVNGRNAFAVTHPPALGKNSKHKVVFEYPQSVSQSLSVGRFAYHGKGIHPCEKLCKKAFFEQLAFSHKMYPSRTVGNNKCRIRCADMVTGNYKLSVSGNILPADTFA